MHEVSKTTIHISNNLFIVFNLFDCLALCHKEKNKKRIKEQITSNKRVIFTEAVGMEEIFTAFVLPDILPCQAGVVRV